VRAGEIPTSAQPSAVLARGAALFRRLWDGLSSVPGVRCFGPERDAPRTATIAFVVEGVASSEVVRRLATKGLFCCHGDFYAPTLMERLGLDAEGLVRAGCACYTTDDEVDRLVLAVRELARR